MSDDRNHFLMVMARISYPRLFERDKYDRFSAKLVMPEDSKDAKAYLEARKAVLAKTKLTNSKLRNDCFDPEPDVSENPETEGCVVVSVKNKRSVAVISNNKRDPETGKPARIENAEDSPIYAGCWVKARINVYAFENSHGATFATDLVAVQFAKDDEPFTGGVYSEGVAMEGFEADEDAGDGMFD